MKLEKPFVVVGFSVSGKVKNGSNGIKGATILLNGAPAAETDSEGYSHVASFR